jgi:hypothetical protein
MVDKSKSKQGLAWGWAGFGGGQGGADRRRDRRVPARTSAPERPGHSTTAGRATRPLTPQAATDFVSAPLRAHHRNPHSPRFAERQPAGATVCAGGRRLPGTSMTAPGSESICTARNRHGNDCPGIVIQTNRSRYFCDQSSTVTQKHLHIPLGQAGFYSERFYI